MKRATKATIETMRKALGGLMALAGLVALSAAPARAAATDTVGITFTIRDNFPPTRVPDLAANGTGTLGEARLTWTAPDEDGGAPIVGGFPMVPPSGQPAQTYVLKLATFSLADVGGSTTTWWAQAQAASGVPSPGAPGAAESLLLTLSPGEVYWFALQSCDGGGNCSFDAGFTGGGQTTVTLLDPFRPAPVAGFNALTAGGGLLDVVWSPVTQNFDGSPANDILGYRVYRSNSPFGPFTVFGSTAPAASTAASLAVSAGDEYYMILAVDQTGNESAPADSNLIHVTPQGIVEQIDLASDGSPTRAAVPQELMDELKNQTTDLLLRVRLNNDPALNADTRRTLRTYTVELSGPVSTTPEQAFAFSKPNMKVVLQYANAGDPAAPPAEQVGVLWWNGVKWIKLGYGEVDPVLNTVSFDAGLIGTYQLRRFQASTGLTLDKASVFPRIFTPNGDGKNDVVYFVVENPRLSEVRGQIYDLAGAFVADVRPAGSGAPTDDSLMWDGRDKQGNSVPAGAYFYQIKGEGKVITGTIVVAK